MTDSYQPQDFDDWAETYDHSVSDWQTFPFTGYKDVLKTIVAWAEVRRGMRVLDLGTGTGNLAVRFAALGCELWCTDFSFAMLEKTRAKLPEAHFVTADLRGEWPAELAGRFDRIVSAYVFHHFALDEKIHLIKSLVTRHLSPHGRLVIGDISFQNRDDLDSVKAATGNEWEDEFYWLADESLSALKRAGLQADYRQISFCAGVFKNTMQ